MGKKCSLGPGACRQSRKRKKARPPPNAKKEKKDEGFNAGKGLRGQGKKGKTKKRGLKRFSKARRPNRRKKDGWDH